MDAQEPGKRWKEGFLGRRGFPMGMDFVWLQVGIATIDDQHRELFSTISRLIEALSRNHGEAEIDRVFAFLEGYTQQHFGLEEAYMREHAYPEAEAHLQAHAVFVDSIAALQRRYHAEGDAAMAAIAACDQLGEWLVDHIAKKDRQLGEFLQARV